MAIKTEYECVWSSEWSGITVSFFQPHAGEDTLFGGHCKLNGIKN